MPNQVNDESKSEARSPKSDPLRWSDSAAKGNPNGLRTCSHALRHSDFGIPSDFGIRISGFIRVSAFITLSGSSTDAVPAPAAGREIWAHGDCGRRRNPAARCCRVSGSNIRSFDRVRRLPNPGRLGHGNCRTMTCFRRASIGGHRGFGTPRGWSHHDN